MPPSFSSPSECPHSPFHVTHCRCGKSIIAPSSSVDRSQHTFAAAQIPSPLAPPLVRIPTRCSHLCQAKCHTGPCLPCTIKITRSCRCGWPTRSLPCHQIQNSGSINHTAEESEVLCDRPCTVLRTCNVVGCCLLASLASTSIKKGKKRVGPGEGDRDGHGIGEEPGGLHECQLIWEKMLSSRNHWCKEGAHTGRWPPSLRSSFEEVCIMFVLLVLDVCSCGPSDM